MKPTEAIHLGDGAYASVGRYRGEVVLTANHHDPAQASDRVYLDPYAVKSLIDWVNAHRGEADPCRY